MNFEQSLFRNLGRKFSSQIEYYISLQASDKFLYRRQLVVSSFSNLPDLSASGFLDMRQPCAFFC